MFLFWKIKDKTQKSSGKIYDNTSNEIKFNHLFKGILAILEFNDETGIYQPKQTLFELTNSESSNIYAKFELNLGTYANFVEN